MASDGRRALGRAGEDIAAEHLRRRGFAILERNFRTRWGELDLVACDARHLVFCEVKTRSSASAGVAGDPLDAVHTAKRNQVRRMAAQWLIERRDRPRVALLRFDAIGIVLDAGG